MEKFILASASPRRKEILSNVNIDFKVVVSDTDEGIINKDAITPDLYVQELALLKANAVLSKIKNEKGAAFVVGADTVVCLDGEILEKPSDSENAFDMLSSLSGREHEVYTGICVMRTSDAFSATDVCRTRVLFKELSEETIRAYINTGEPMDKAGAYGIQGLGAVLIKEICGDYFNVMGFPVSTFADLLKSEFGFDILQQK